MALPARLAHARPVGCAFNRNANGVRTGTRIAADTTQRFAALPAALAQRGPLGLRLNGDANGVRDWYTVCGWDGAEDSWRCLPDSPDCAARWACG